MGWIIGRVEEGCQIAKDGCVALRYAESAGDAAAILRSEHMRFYLPACCIG